MCGTPCSPRLRRASHPERPPAEGQVHHLDDPVGHPRRVGVLGHDGGMVAPLDIYRTAKVLIREYGVEDAG